MLLQVKFSIPNKAEMSSQLEQHFNAYLDINILK